MVDDDVFIKINFAFVGIIYAGFGRYRAVLGDDFRVLRNFHPLQCRASRFLVAKAAVEAFFAKTWVKLALVAIVVLVIVFVLWLKLGRRSRRYGSRGGKRRQQRAYRGRRRW